MTGLDLDAITRRFETGNSVPVERAFLTREEWDEIRGLLLVERTAGGHYGAFNIANGEDIGL